MNIIMKIVETKEERQLAMELRKSVFIVEQGVPPALEQDQYEDISIHIMAQYGDDVVATARLRPYHDQTSKVERVAVSQAYRDLGIGKKLMNYIEEVAQNKGDHALILDAQEHALPFYEKLGFHATGKPFMEAGMKHMTMAKQLPSPAMQ